MNVSFENTESSVSFRSWTTRNGRERFKGPEQQATGKGADRLSEKRAATGNKISSPLCDERKHYTKLMRGLTWLTSQQLAYQEKPFPL